MRGTKLTVITDTSQIRQNKPTSSRTASQPPSRDRPTEGDHSKETEVLDGDEVDDEEEEPSSPSSTASIPDENIDFALVYALHSFNATLEGQTTVVRGDSMQLLDDSNSYWWLVRSTLTEKMGYIPAENIETPYERLARLNRFRNIKLSSSQQHETLGPGKEDLSRSKEGEGTKQRRVNFSENLILPSPTGVGDIYYEDEDEDEDMEEEESEDEEVFETSNCSTKSSDEKTTDQNVHQENRKETEEEEDNSKEKEKEKSGGRFFDKIIHSMTNRQPAATTNVRSEVSSEEKSSALQNSLNADGVDPTEKRTSTTNGSAQPYSRIRVFSGNLGGAPLFKTLPVTEETTVHQLTSAAVERFHIKEDGGSEYYLTIKGLSGEETRLNADDRPMDVYRTLYNGVAGSSDQQNPNDVPVKFFLQKRISRVNQRQGQLIFRVLWYPPQKISNSVQDSKSKRTSSLIPGSRKRGDTPFSSSESILEDDSQVISKLISVGTEATANEVLVLALEKFNVTAASGEQAFPNDDSGYFLVCMAPGESGHVLSPNQPVKELLLDRSGSSAPPARQTSLNASAMPANSKNPHFEEELHLVLTRKPRPIDSAPKRMSSLSIADREYRKSFMEGTGFDMEPPSPVTSQSPQIPDIIDTSPLEEIVLSETFALQETSSLSKDQPHNSAQNSPRSSQAEQNVGASSRYTPDGSTKGTVSQSTESVNAGSLSENNARPEPVETTTVEAKRGPDRADMVIGKGISSSPSFTLRARAEDENNLERSSKRNSRLRLSLVLTPQELSFDNGEEEVEIDVSDVINDIIYGGGSDEEKEEEEDVLVSQEFSLGLNDSLNGSDADVSSVVSEPRRMDGSKPRESTNRSSLVPTESPDRAGNVTNPESKTSSNSAPPKDLKRSSPGETSPDGDEMLDDLEAYLNSLKADLSKEKLGKLETVLNKVKKTAMKRLSSTAPLETPMPKRDSGSEKDDEIKRPSKTIPPTSRNGIRSPPQKQSLYDDAGLNDLLVMVRSGWTDEMVAAAKPSITPNSKLQKIDKISTATDWQSETVVAHRMAGERLDEMEQELNDLLSRVTSSWSTSAGP